MDTHTLPDPSGANQSSEQASADEQESAAIIRPPADWHTMTSQPVFVIEDSFFRTRTPRPTHWSIAWSDLMMTMFILFLTLFVYQLAHRRFLEEKNNESFAGKAVKVQTPLPGMLFPFDPIFPRISPGKAESPEKVEQIEKKRIPTNPVLENTDLPITAITKQGTVPSPVEAVLPEEPIFPSPDKLKKTAKTVPHMPMEVTDPFQPLTSAEHRITPDPYPAPAPPTERQEIIAEIYDLSQVTLTEEKLKRFASVEVIPDKAVRIILTGDLLFASGKSDISPYARRALLQLAPIIQRTPYMINVEGHTDSVPINSPVYPTNWELSVARASRVARFLIEEMGVSEEQLVVSGYSYYRPLKPNTSAQNRSANRRVELILSKEPPPVMPATGSELQ